MPATGKPKMQEVEMAAEKPQHVKLVGPDARNKRGWSVHVKDLNSSNRRGLGVLPQHLVSVCVIKLEQ